MSNNQELNEELLKCFDNQGNEIEPMKRGIVHTKPLSVWHAVVNIWLINSSGEILCSKRSEEVSGNSGKWQTYFGGHVRSDSTFAETALREIEEEIGLDLKPNEIKSVETGIREDSMHRFENFVVLFDKDKSELKFNDGEITETKWYNFKEYSKLKEENPENWCNGMNEGQYEKAIKVLDIKLA